MTTEQLLKALEARGLTVKAGKSGPVLVGNPALVTEAVRRALRWHRDAILTRLGLQPTAQPAPPNPPAREVSPGAGPAHPPAREGEPIPLDAADRPCSPAEAVAWQWERKLERRQDGDGRRYWRWAGGQQWYFVSKKRPMPSSPR